MNESTLVGTWKLRSFLIYPPGSDSLDKTREPKNWADAGSDQEPAEPARGLLIYTADGHMSIGFNRDLSSKTKNRFERVYDAVLFYSGKWKTNSAQVEHEVLIASEPDRVGKTVVRTFVLKGNELTLTAPEEAFGTTVLVWERVSPSWD